MFPGEQRLEVHRDGENQHVIYWNKVLYVSLVLILHVAQSRVEI